MHCLQRHLQGRSWNSTLPSFHESLELRTSTLAALVIAGGTIAALPFRRFSSDLDEPAPATGPTSSMLGEAEFPPLKSVAHDRHQSQISAAPPNQRIELPPWDSSSLDIEPERRVELPLTFDDLMLPIDRPRPIAEQYEAVVDRPAATEPPPQFNRLSQVSERSSGGKSEPNNLPRIKNSPSLPPPVSGSLATSKMPAEPEKNVRADPPLAPLPVVRDRAWIRQP